MWLLHHFRIVWLLLGRSRFGFESLRGSHPANCAIRWVGYPLIFPFEHSPPSSFPLTLNHSETCNRIAWIRLSTERRHRSLRASDVTQQSPNAESLWSGVDNLQKVQHSEIVSTRKRVTQLKFEFRGRVQPYADSSRTEGFAEAWETRETATNTINYYKRTRRTKQKLSNSCKWRETTQQQREKKATPRPKLDPSHYHRRPQHRAKHSILHGQYCRHDNIDDDDGFVRIELCGYYLLRGPSKKILGSGKKF